MPRAVSGFLPLLWIAFAVLPSARAGETRIGIQAVAAQTDPAKLATLKGDRAANDRLHKILAWLEENRRAGMVPSRTIDEAQKITGDSPAHAVVVKEMLLRNFELCERAAVFTEANLTRMKQGRAPLVVSGTYVGEAYEVDHTIPVREFPALGKELANLLYLPRTVNRRKSDDIKQRALDLGQKLTAAGVLTKEDYARLHEIKTWDTAEMRASVPRESSTPAPISSAPRPKSSGQSPSASSPVNLNTATIEEIQALPGIGPKTAAHIISARPLKDFQALDSVPGLGAKKIEALRDLVSF